MADLGIRKGIPRSGRSRGMIMYVEDDEDARASMEVVLETAGFDVCLAANGASALAQVDALRNRLDVLIVDYYLGISETGTEIAKSLVQRLGHGVPTVILTGDPANAEMPWLKNSPVWLVRKPVSHTTLIAGLWPLVIFGRAMRRLRE